MNHVRWENNTLYGISGSSSILLRLDAAAIGTNSDIVVSNNIGAWSAAGGSNSVTIIGVTFENNLWFNVTAGSAAGSGDVTGNPLFAK